MIANSCEAIAHIKEATPQVQAAASRFGKFLGLAFQIQDDRLDFVANTSQLGKVKIYSLSKICKYILVDYVKHDDRKPYLFMPKFSQVYV